MKKLLDLGCGKNKKNGAIGVDWSNRHNADIVHNLNVLPYPFKDNEFDEIYLDNVLEHLNEIVPVLEEVYRICKTGGVVKIVAPYFRSVWACIDPTHRHFFTVDTFSYFDPRHPICQRYEYSFAQFYVEKIVFNETIRSRLFGRFVSFFANKYPKRYEYYLSHLLPLDDITYYLKKV